MKNDFSGYWVQIPNFVIDDKNLSDRAFKVLCVLSTYINASGFGWPSQQTLAERCGCKRLTIYRAINELIQAGYITKTNLFRDDEGQTVNAYSITYKKEGVSNMIHQCIKNDIGGCIKNDIGGVSNLNIEQESKEQKYNFKNYTQCAPARVYTREEKNEVTEQSPVTEADIERWQVIEEEMNEEFTPSEMSFIRAFEFWKDYNGKILITSSNFCIDKAEEFDFARRFAALENCRGLEFEVLRNCRPFLNSDRLLNNKTA